MNSFITLRSIVLLSIFNLLLSNNTFSQQSIGINYQGIARRADGNPLADQSISIKLTVRDGSKNGSSAFSEVHQVKTNPFGLFSVVIGSAAASSQIGTLANVNWKTGNKFLQVEIDPGGGNNFITMGTSQLQSVPYAIHAEQAAPIGIASGDLTGTYPNPLVSKIQGKAISNLMPSSGQVLKWDGKEWIPSEDISGAGIQGEKGDKGDPGVNGVNGTNGAPGINGTNGTDGVPGLKGDKGDPGINGTNGTDGVPGLKGDKGDPGTNGTNGTDGAPGIKGDKGDPGINGTNGANGAPGIKGDKGDPGINGTNGLNGAPGLKGEKGDPGTNGTNGTDGAPGLKGDKGDPGTNGINGTDGAPGINGVNGTDGVPGLKGDKGDPGLQGPSGILDLATPGNVGNVLTSDGNTWISAAVLSNPALSGLSNFTESNYLYNTKTGVKLQASNSADHVDLILSAKGTGGILAQQADGLVSGGNNRGSKAVDLQMIRGLNSQVASGNYAVISGGENNTASGTIAFVGGGGGNTASGHFSFVGGRGNTAQSYGETVLGVNSTIGAGQASAYSANDRLFVVGNGTFSSNRSNAITVLKNANTSIGGSLTLNENGSNTSFSLPTDRGTSGQVLTTNGAGLATWSNPSLIGLNNFTESNYLYNTKTGVKLQASNSADHVDLVLSAKGAGAILAQEADGTAIGGNNRGSNAVDLQMFRGSNSQVASGDFAVIGGGANNTASGNYSVAMGFNSSANSANEFVIGSFNTPASSNQNWAATDPLFTIGNGTNSATSNAVQVLKNGNTAINGSLDLNGASETLNQILNDDDDKLNVIDGTLKIQAENDSGENIALRILGNDSNDYYSGGKIIFGDYVPGRYGVVIGEIEDDVLSIDANEVVVFGSKKGGDISVFGDLTVEPGYKYYGDGSKLTGIVTTDFVIDAISSSAKGLSNFTESNYLFNTKSGVKLQASNLADNVDLVLSPKGTGAILAQQADGTDIGGNNRGSNAVDLQMFRGSNSQVASGSSSVIAGGNSNTASETYAVISGGNQNTASGNTSVIAGGNANIASETYAVISGGNQNAASGSSSVIAGGNSNTASETYAVISGGNQNIASGNTSVIAGGNSNTASETYAVISGGNQNIASGNTSVIAGGNVNTASKTYAVISGGNQNTASGNSSVIAGGNVNTASETYAVISGGNQNTASGNSAVVSGGDQNTASGNASVVVGGFANTASGKYSFVGGGIYNYAPSYGETVLGLFSTVGSGDPLNFNSLDRLFVIGNGTSTDTESRSNAITVLKNANTTIGGSLTINQNGTNTSFSLPTDRGTSGQVLTTNGSGLASWANPTIPQDAATKAYVDLLEAKLTALEAKFTALEARVPAQVGDFRAGGVVFWVDPSDNTHGLVCAIQDQGIPIQWYNGINIITGATGTAIGTGASNTNAILAAQGATLTNYAAGLARSYTGGGFNDWFLPSEDELNEMYLKRVAINGTATAKGGSAFELNNGYWSSTESDIGNASYQIFGSGFRYHFLKSWSNNVRAVRAF